MCFFLTTKDGIRMVQEARGIGDWKKRRIKKKTVFGILGKLFAVRGGGRKVERVVLAINSSLLIQSKRL